MIHARNLSRTFRTKSGLVDAVRDLSLDVARGELVAFLGPNGAGKSTSVRLLTTLLPITSGTARVAGHDVANEPHAVRRALGYVGQGTGSGPYHRVRDELVLQGRAQRMTEGASRARADELLALLELGDVADRNCATLSGGQKRRLDVALGLMHTPELLILDEPSTGLDPQSRAHLWSHILELRRRTGMTVFLTTHYLEEADAMAERVMIMDRGTLIADDTPDRLKAELAGDELQLVVHREEDARLAAEIAENRPDAREAKQNGRALTLKVSAGDRALPALVRELHARGVELESAFVTRPTLDDVFLPLTGRSLRDQAA